MKKRLKIVYFYFFLILASATMSSCQENIVKPSYQDGNIPGSDDWEKPATGGDGGGSSGGGGGGGGGSGWFSN